LSVDARTLRDELDLRRLVDAYAIAVDDGDSDALASLFAPGGSLLVYNAGSDKLEHSYRDDQFAQLTATLAEAFERTFHLVGNVVVHLNGDRATGTAYCLASHLRDDGRGPQVGDLRVRYRDRYLRTDDGWRFEERAATVLWRERRPTNQWPPKP
jgi:hypothetical protein